MSALQPVGLPIHDELVADLQAYARIRERFMAEITQKNQRSDWWWFQTPTGAWPGVDVLLAVAAALAVVAGVLLIGGAA